MNNSKINSGKKSKGLVVITGCDTGIGKSLAGILVQRGYGVVISYVDKNPFGDEKVPFARKMDHRIPEETEDFCKYVRGICKEGRKLEAVIANSGVALGGPIENIPIGIYRESFEINYFGAVKVIQSLIPELILNKGKIIIHGSMAGRIAMPFLSPYVSTKFALEGFCDSLRREMKPFGVKTVLLETAAVATPIWNKAKNQDISFVEEKYMDSLYRFRDNFIEGGNHGMDVDDAAGMIANILLEKNPKARYIIAKNILSPKLLLRLPAMVIDIAVVKMFKMYYGKK
ncbi:MAG: SDR family NAD(P)-dependent oxidoreductase [Eubacteriaceae bacterium]|nr:SDR family NAD(P)-dependent oxidoreductase [Eubacteriaceae bacterium]